MTNHARNINKLIHDASTCGPSEKNPQKSLVFCLHIFAIYCPYNIANVYVICMRYKYKNCEFISISSVFVHYLRLFTYTLSSNLSLFSCYSIVLTKMYVF